ncbi:hypothetical protein B0J12DRAFT_769248 [Macrophomina phaseolina]|uniref:Fungal N-terminal domain-containing protein n=1 Tax=Macrophomina phaseolina TaxID=35725 RepID=A0ABQ8GL29_9PEZI|nr:hypothetical protein B0J12DRAFT_769248 [Macrophomina phaseolina]
MAPSEAVSTVANAFSVVGLADIVFKYGQEVYETLAKIQRAPQEISELLGEVKDIEGNVARIRILLSDFEESSFPQHEKQAIHSIEALLSRCHQELLFIRKLAKEAISAAKDGWFAQFSISTSWVWNEQDIALSRRRLARLREEMNSMLTLVGRRNDIIIHTEIKNTRADLAQASSDSSAALAHLTTVTNTVGEKIDSVSTGMLAFAQEGKSVWNDFNTAISDTQHVAKVGTAKVQRQLTIAASNSKTHYSLVRKEIVSGTRLVHNDLRAVSKGIRHSRRQQARQQSSATTQIMGKMEEMETKMMQSIATLSLTQTAEGAFTFEGKNVESVTLPLMLLHSQLLKALPILRSEGKIPVSQAEASWIQQQFEAVLAASHEISAKAAGLYAVVKGRAAVAMQPSGWQSNTGSEPQEHAQMAQSNTQHGAVQLKPGFWYDTGHHEMPAGVIDFMVTQVVNDEEHLKHESFRSITFSFMPNPDLWVTGISATFTKDRIYGSRPVLPSLRIWNVVPRNSAAFSAVASNDVKELRRLFDTRSASPFDRTPDGHSLAAEAVRHRHYEVFELLLRQGAGIHELQWAYDDFGNASRTNSTADYINNSRIFSLVETYVPDLFFCFKDLDHFVNIFRVMPLEVREAISNPCASSIDATALFGPFINLMNFQASLEPDTVFSASTAILVLICDSRTNITRKSDFTSGMSRVLATHGLPRRITVDSSGRCGFHVALDALKEGYHTNELAIPFFVLSLENGYPANLADKQGRTPTDAVRLSARKLLVWKEAVHRAGYRYEELHCGDGTTLYELVEDLLGNPRNIPDDRKLLEACGMDQLGGLAEAILMDSSLLREAWFYGIEDDGFLLLDSLDIRDYWYIF